MKLTAEQAQSFDRDGFLILPDLIADEEIALMRRECERLAAIDTDRTIDMAGIRTVYRCHELDGPTGSPVFHAAARLPRLLEPARQLLGDDAVYVFNSRLYGKKALVGSAMMWHQDFGYWRLDRVPSPNLLSVMVMLGDVDVLDGCLWVIPGSHKLGTLPHYADTSTPFKQWPVNQERMKRVLDESPAPVPLCGRRGTVTIHHAQTIHASGQNLSGSPRWQLYFVYNPTANAPSFTSRSRPDFICSQNTAPLDCVADDALLRLRQTTAA